MLTVAVFYRVDFKRVERHCQSIEGKHPVDEWIARPYNKLDGFGGLYRAGDSDHSVEDSVDGAGEFCLAGDGRGVENAAVAGAPGNMAEHLAREARHSSEYEFLAEHDASVVD